MISASHVGVSVDHPVTNRKLLAFPRVLAYICDQPEERAILGLKGGACRLPCTNFDVTLKAAGATAALRSRDRAPLATLQRQYDAAMCRRRPGMKRRAAALEAMDCSAGAVPALGGMAGLCTPPYLLYKMIGLDVLHVRYLSLSCRMLNRLLAALHSAFRSFHVNHC